MGYNASNLEQMMEIFLELDSNNDGVVDVQELMQACEDKKLTMEEVIEFKNRFDTDENNKISIHEFCRALGLKSSELIIEKEERANQRAGVCRTLPEDVEVIATVMSMEKQVDVIEKFKDLCQEYGDDAEHKNKIVQQFKDYLDKTYGRVWQVIVLTGSYWMKYSHEPFLALQFKYKSNICLIWRTPCS